MQNNQEILLNVANDDIKNGTYEIPGHIKEIGRCAFRDCTSLTTIAIPVGVKEIGPCAFGNCSNLKSITIPFGVTGIYDYTFSYCKSLTDIILPDGVTYVGDSVFFACHELKTVTIPASVTEIDFKAFRNCSSLSQIFINAPHTEFERVKNLLPKTLHDKVVTFRNPKTLKEITADYLFSNKVKFFKKLSTVPLDCIEKFPGLDIDYKRIFIRNSQVILNDLKFTPEGEERTYLQQLYNALKEENPYNSMHQVIQKIDSKIKVEIFSQFKTHMQPIRNELVKLMKEYVLNKNEYNLQMNIK